LREAVVATKLYTTICSSAPSELLAALALRHREQLAERNRALVLENLALADAFVAGHPELADWVRPTASPIGFPRLRVPDTHAFCERLAAEEGVLLLPGEVYDEPGHVRFGLGRLCAADAFARLSAFVERGAS
jgi:aspartate/methionine/tyrosine aminotransferase